MCRIFFAAFTFLCLAHGEGIRPYVIDTFAGTYPLGDGGPATEALLQFPESALPGPNGTLYIADRGNARVRVVAADGTIRTLVESIAARDLALDEQGNLYVASNSYVFRVTPQGGQTTIAGSSDSGYSGDGGPATEARLELARAIARAPDGTLYIADDESQVIRRIAPDGIITTYAGNGTYGYSGDGGPATAAAFENPAGLALDAAGNLYIADFYNRRVRKVAPDGTITTFAGNGEYGTPADGALAVESPIENPAGVFVDPQGNVYISDDFASRIYRVAPDGTIRTVAGTGDSGFGGEAGPALSAQLDGPRTVRMDEVGNLIIADRRNHRIRRIDLAGNIDTVAGRAHFGGDGGPATQALLFSPTDAAGDSRGNVYIVDRDNYRIRRVAPDGTISTYAGNGGTGDGGDGGLATDAEFTYPLHLAVDSQDNLYIAGKYYIRRVRTDGIIEAVAGRGDRSTGDEGPAINASFGNLGGIAVGPDDTLYVADTQKNVVRRITPDGNIHPFAGTGESGYSGDGGPALAARLRGPLGVSADKQGNVFFADGSNSRIRKVDPAGVITTFAGNGKGGTPTDGQLATSQPLVEILDAAVDSDGSLVVCGWTTVFKIMPSGLIYHIAGSTSGQGNSGDGGLATNALLGTIRGLGTSATGEIYLADEDNHRVRRLTPDPPALLEAANGAVYTGLAGQRLAEPLAVRVIGTTGLPLPGVTVSYAVTSGEAVLDATNVVADSMGVSSAYATLGDAPGELTVTASITGLAPVEFTVRAINDPSGIDVLPAISAGGIVGGGLSIPPVLAVSPIGIATIYGSNFAPPGTLIEVGPGDLVNGRLPTSLANVCVEMGSQLAYILHVLDTQLNIQVPALTPGTQVAVRVIRNCGTPNAVKSEVEMATVQETSPEFLFWVRNMDGVNPVAAVNPVTAQYVGEPGVRPDLTLVRARPGDLIDFYTTGFGATDPPVAPGEIPTQLASTVARPEVFLGGMQVPDEDVVYSGVTQYAGVYLLRIRVPQLSAGDHSVQVRFGANTSPPGAYLTVGE